MIYLIVLIGLYLLAGLAGLFNCYKIKWILLIPLALSVTIICWVTNPLACILTVRTDGRDDLIPFFKLWQTYDCHVDEFYYGGYDLFAPVQRIYDASAWARYCYRLSWLTRNTGYGWSYLLFSIPKGMGFQLKGQTRAIFGFYNDYNIGWKAHTGFDKLDYACRIIGLRKLAKAA